MEKEINTYSISQIVWIQSDDNRLTLLYSFSTRGDKNEIVACYAKVKTPVVLSILFVHTEVSAISVQIC